VRKGAADNLSGGRPIEEKEKESCREKRRGPGRRYTSVNIIAGSRSLKKEGGPQGRERNISAKKRNQFSELES